MRARVVLAVAAVLVCAACEPDYGASDASTRMEPPGAVTGGADPTAMSGRVKQPGEPNIQHPNADGNAGRPPDGPGAPAGYRDTSGVSRDSTGQHASE
jgi:hypothetical protein